MCRSNVSVEIVGKCESIRRVIDYLRVTVSCLNVCVYILIYSHVVLLTCLKQNCSKYFRLGFANRPLHVVLRAIRHVRVAFLFILCCSQAWGYFQRRMVYDCNSYSLSVATVYFFEKCKIFLLNVLLCATLIFPHITISSPASFWNMVKLVRILDIRVEILDDLFDILF